MTKNESYAEEVSLYNSSVYVLTGLGIASLLIALLVRVLFTYVCVLGAGFNVKEKIFIALAWMPKATVQVSQCWNMSVGSHWMPSLLCASADFMA